MFRHYSKVVSTLALVVSLGTGGAYAASQVNGATIKNHTIPATKLTPAAVKMLHGASGTNGTDGKDGTNGVTTISGACSAETAALVKALQDLLGDEVDAEPDDGSEDDA